MYFPFRLFYLLPVHLPIFHFLHFSFVVEYTLHFRHVCHRVMADVKISHINEMPVLLSVFWYMKNVQTEIRSSHSQIHIPKQMLGVFRVRGFLYMFIVFIHFFFLPRLLLHFYFCSFILLLKLQHWRYFILLLLWRCCTRNDINQTAAFNPVHVIYKMPDNHISHNTIRKIRNTQFFIFLRFVVVACRLVAHTINIRYIASTWRLQIILVAFCHLPAMIGVRDMAYRVPYRNSMHKINNMRSERWTYGRTCAHITFSDGPLKVFVTFANFMNIHQNSYGR